MKKFLPLLLSLVMVLALVACGYKKDDTNTDDQDNNEVTDFKVGFIMLHDENSTYDLNFINAAKEACETLGVEYTIVTNVPEGQECYDKAAELADAGCNIIFADSFGHEDYMIQAAKEHKDVQFCHATGTKAHTEKLDNFHNAFASIYEGRYLAGIAAGMKLNAMIKEGKFEAKDAKIGYVGAFPYAEVKSGYTAFFLGIRSIVPEAHMDVQYTKEWFDLVKESEAANALMARGCVIIGQHADSTGAPSAVQAKYEAGETVFSVGYNIDMLSVAPDVALTSPQNNWGAYYTYAFEQVMNGKKPVQNWCHGYSNNAVQISPLGKACAAGTQEAVDAAIEKIKSGELKVFDCSTFTVNGEHLTSYDKSKGFEGTQLIWDGYFHESEVISAPLFDIRIDGITELSK